MVLAYQTDRNELVGVVRVRSGPDMHKCVYFKAVERFRMKVRPLKQLDGRIAAIPAFRPGQIRTLYDILPSDVNLLLKAAGATTKAWKRDPLPSVAIFMLRRVPLVFSPQPEGGFTVTSPVLPELVTEGDTLEEAFANVPDAVTAVVELYAEQGRPLPCI